MSALTHKVENIWSKPETIPEPVSVEDYYHENVSFLVAPYERLRLEQVVIAKFREKVSIFLGLGFIGIFLMAAYLGYIDGENSLKFSIYGLIVVIGGLIFWCSRPAAHMNSEIKSKVFPKILGYLDGDFSFNLKPPFKVVDLKDSGIIPNFTSERTEDYISGIHDGVKIEVFEATLKQKQGKRSVTVFTGMFVVLSVHKNFSSKTIIKKDGGAVGNWFGKAIKTFSSLERVKLEDPVFEEKYEVYSDDQIEARFLLTPAFMERLLHLGMIPEFRHATNPIECSFYDDKFLLKIPVPHNRFETAHISEPIDFLNDTKKLINEMNEIFQIIKVLKMNQRMNL